jgi:hypothetical protein
MSDLPNPRGVASVPPVVHEHISTALAPRMRRISWGAVLAGFFVAAAVQVVLTLLGLGIGLTTIEPATEGVPSASTFGTGTVVWWLTSSIIALFTGGIVAGRLAGIPVRLDSAMHGLLTWCLMTVVSLVLVTTVAGRLLSAAGTAVSYAMAGVGRAGVGVLESGAREVADRVGEPAVVNSIRQEFRGLLRDTGKTELQPENLRQASEEVTDEARTGAAQAATQPATAGQEAERVFNDFITQAQQTGQAVDREAVVNVLTTRTNMSRAEAQQVVDRWVSQSQKARETIGQKLGEMRGEAAETTEKAAHTLSWVALWSCVAMVLGAVCAGFGGWFGAPERMLSEQLADSPFTDRPMKT